MKFRRKLVTYSFVLVFISFILSTVISMYSLHRMSVENQRDVNILMAARIHDTITSQMTKPIMVAKTMANDKFILDFLEYQEDGDLTGNVAVLQGYLSRLRTGLGYSSAFVISDKTHRYYTAKGLNKIVNPLIDDHDIWYSKFVETGKQYDLDVDRDEANIGHWTVFLNARIENYGKYLGVCGVGVQMNNVQEMLDSFESQYGVKVSLVNDKGVVQVDTNEIDIESAVLDGLELDDVDEYRFCLDEDQDEYVVTKYIDEMNLFLVVRNKVANIGESYMKVVTLNAPIFLFVALMLAGAWYVVDKHQQSLADYSYRDKLTGRYNRRRYEEDLQALKRYKLSNDFVYIMADVNGLKRVNDTLGHAAGDELIDGAAKCLARVGMKYGRMYRIGGDEFAAICYFKEDELEQACKDFKEIVDNWQGQLVDKMSISVGIVTRREMPDASLMEIIQEADKRMYADKAAFYERTGLKRG